MKKRAGKLNEQSRGLGTVTREMVEKRAGELAILKGRSQHEVLHSDVEEARRELLGIEDESPAEQVPESRRWDPIGGTPGKKAEAVEASDEQTVAEELVQEGVDEAEHDQAIEAERAMRKREQ